MPTRTTWIVIRVGIFTFHLDFSYTFWGIAPRKKNKPGGISRWAHIFNI